MTDTLRFFLSNPIARFFPSTRERLLGLLVLVLVLRLPSFFHPVMDMDETEYAGVACRMLEGGLPYRDGMIIKFPGILYIYTGAFWLFGRYNMLSVHLVTACFAFATAVVCRMIAKRLYDDASGWIAAVFYAIFSVGFYPKMQAANTEMFAVLPSTLAGFAYIEARRVNRTYYLFLAGLFAGLAILFKQTAALLPFALAMGSVVNTWRKERRFLPGIEASALLGLGVLVALIPMALYLHVWGVLEDAVFWTWTYIFHHYFPSVHDSYLQRLLGIPVLLIGAMAPVIALAWFARHHNVWPLGWWLVSMFLSGFAGGRMFGHYFLLAIPPLCVLAGIGARTLWSEYARHAHWLKLIAGTTIVLAAIQLFRASVIEEPSGSFWSPKPDHRPAAAHIREATHTDERIYVWGRSPLLYVAGERCPSTRFVYAHHLAGVSATDHAGARGHAVPEGWRQLMEDLEHSPPAYVLDTSRGDYSFNYAPIENYPLLWSFVSRFYTYEQEIAGVRFFRKK